MFSSCNSLKSAIVSIIKENGYLYERFKMVFQPDCCRKLCFTNGAIAFEIDPHSRQVNFYECCEIGARPAKIITID